MPVPVRVAYLWVWLPLVDAVCVCEPFADVVALCECEPLDDTEWLCAGMLLTAIVLVAEPPVVFGA